MALQVINIGLGIKQMKVEPKGITVPDFIESLSHKVCLFFGLCSLLLFSPNNLPKTAHPSRTGQHRKQPRESEAEMPLHASRPQRCVHQSYRTTHGVRLLLPRVQCPQLPGYHRWQLNHRVGVPHIWCQARRGKRNEAEAGRVPMRMCVLSGHAGLYICFP